jgi:hypothetical protein
MSVILALSSPSSKALLILYTEMALIWSLFHLACRVRGIGPIMAILRGVAFAERGSGGSSLVPWTVTTLSLQSARQYWDPKVPRFDAKWIVTSGCLSYGIPSTIG